MAANFTNAELSSPSLLSFDETFNFSQFVKEHLVVDQSKEVAEVITKSAHIVGQERDGSVLFSWDVPVGASLSRYVTKVGLYSTSRLSYQVLYTHDETITIICASVNADRTLLAFSTREIADTNVSYESFIAEIQPQGRMLSLNLGSCDFRKVQFIYASSQNGGSRRPNRSPSLNARLLVIIPGHWICLYIFNLETVDKGVMITRQPKSSLLTENAPWYQWDPVNQWLYYTRFETTASGSSRKTRNSLMLCVLSFEESVEHTVFTVSLPISYPSDHYLGSATFYDNQVALSPPIHELNMCVLHNDEGLWCVCLQNPGKNAAMSSPQPTRKQGDQEAETEIHYSVFIIHNGHVMDARVTLPGSSTRQYHLSFMLFQSCVVAYIPGVLFHLLNVGPRTDPCHHLILDHVNSPILPTMQGSTAKVFAPAKPHADCPILVNAVSTDNGYSIMDTDSQIIYNCCLDPAGLLELFKNPSTSPQTQESLLHLMLVTFQLHTEVLKMLEYVCQTPVSLSDPRIFAEFLMSFSYSCVESDYRHYLVKQLPLTISRTYQGGIYRNSNGSKYVLLRCSEMQGFIKQVLVQSDQRMLAISEDERLMFDYPRNDRFNQLVYLSYLNQPNVYQRISIEEISSRASSPAVLFAYFNSGASNVVKKKAAKRKKITTSPEHLHKSGSIMGRLKLLINSPKSNRASASDEIVDDMPFLLPDEDLNTEQFRKDVIIQDLIRKSLGRKLKLTNKISSTHVQATAEGYWEELQRASLILLKVIWESLEFTMATHPLFESIHRQASSSEVVLFELLESYQMAHIEVGLPLPSGFHTLFISMGYLCLAPVVFLQYLKNGVFTPTTRFLHLLFTQCEDVDDHILFEILSLLDEDLMEIGMGMWKSPVLSMFAVRQS